MPSERLERERAGPRIDAALPGTVGAPKAARTALEELGADVRPDVLEVAQLLASELVSNAVRHTNSGRSDMRVWLDDGRLVIEVRDGGPGFDVQANGDGWGLHIVDELADDWGIAPGPGTRVWCELEVAGAPN